MGSVKIPRGDRLRLVGFATMASFLSNVIGAVFASNIRLFLFDWPYSKFIPLFNVPPFVVSVVFFVRYLTPLFQEGADANLFRRKVLGLPNFFLIVAGLAWLTAAIEVGGIPVLFGRRIDTVDTVMAVASTFGIGIIASSSGYFLLELLNRLYWFPRRFQCFDPYTATHSRISQRLAVYWVTLALSPFIIFCWILSWIVLEYEVLSADQLSYAVGFSGFSVVSGLILSQGMIHLLRNPLVEAQSAVSEVARGNYDVRVPVHSDDELGRLGEGINLMAETLGRNAQRIEVLNREIVVTQAEVIETMAVIAEGRSGETGRHVARVAAYSRLLALAWGVPEEEAELLRQASPMHDIGKVAIPDSILNKKGPLTADEFEVMKTHTILGHSMFAHSERPLLRVAAVVALEHHERYDGGGYPRGLRGDGISRYGRITAVADVFDALGSARVYKPAWEDERIFAHFAEQRGRHFDPELVDLLSLNRAELVRLRTELRDPI